MTERVTLSSGAYSARSLIANAQRCVNLYPESAPPETQAPSPVTHYQTAGLTLQAQPPLIRGGRCMYRATNGALYAVIGPNVYVVAPSTVPGLPFTMMQIGTIADLTTPASMVDNGIVIVLVDGTSAGYAIDMLNGNTFGTISDPAFYGADRVDYVDTYFVFNKPGTAIYYISLSEVDYGMLVGTSVATGTIANSTVSTGTLVGGAGYVPGTYANIALTGGAGTGARATLVVNSSGVVSSLTLTSGGIGYTPSNVLSAPASSLGGTGSGLTYTVTAVVGSSGYVNGQYDGVPLTGGSGTGATADIEVAGNVITSVDMDVGGAGYVLGDVLTASNSNLGGSGVGFAYLVNTFAPAFDALDFAQKSGGPDPLVSVICVHREIWLIGTLASEVAVNTGAADFTFGPLPGAYMEAGTGSKYTVARHSLSIYWLAQDRQGQCIAVQTQGYAVTRISTYALEQEWQTYTTVSDAVGFTYQIDGHQFYVITFPTQDITWVFDEGTGQWHQWAWADNNGVLHRHRAAAYAFAYGMNLVCDWQNGNIYQLDPLNYTDNGAPITRIRSFPHLMDDAKRVTYSMFIADISVGALDTSAVQPQVFFEVILGSDGNKYFSVLGRGGKDYIQLLQGDLSGQEILTLRYSDDRGATWSGAIQQTMGSVGKYLTSVEYRRLGMARDRVFELQWSGALKVALNGAFIDTVDHES